MLDMSQEVSIIHDLESNGLLNEVTVDYTASPWKLKDTFKMHVIAVLEEETNQLIAFYDGKTISLDGRTHEVDVGGYKVVLEGYTPINYLHFPLHKFPDYVKKRKIKKATGHNIINFDLLAYKAFFGLDYTIGEEGDTWVGKPVYHNDTLVKSKTLNPDRFEHNLDYLSRQAGGAKKVDFRPNVPKELKFEVFGADMLYYNLFDLLSTQSVDKYLDKEAGNYPWAGPIQLEKCVMNLITQQSHRGFSFNLELAEKCVKELDIFMAERRERVEPLLPKKKATKTFMKDFTPPKSQFKKDGSLSAHMEKFIQKIGATVKDNDTIVFDGKEFKLPLAGGESLVTEVAASIDDTTHIKEWLVSLGWVPSEWKEKDLTVNTKKQKLSELEYAAAVERYVDQTLNSPFCAERCEYLECTPRTLRTFLLGKNIKRPVRVQTNPNFTKGTDKEMCPDLERISEQFPFAKDVIEYLTFKHRRNSILGGGLDWEDEGDAEKGFMSQVREDGRIPTPADTCGAATSRMKHKGVCNIARVTSLYGKEMRSLFRADPEMCYQIGYDFASLEAVIESHYCNKYEKPTVEGVRAYCESLLQEKPNDVHTKTAEFISGMLGKEFSRGNAKGVKYGCVPVDSTEVLTDKGWKPRSALSLGDMVLSYNKKKGGYEYSPILKLWDYQNAEVGLLKNKWFGVEVTQDHEWLVNQRYTRNTEEGKVRVFEHQKRATHDLNTESSIIGSAVSLLESNFTDAECSLIGWLLSDGYYKWSGKERNKVMGLDVSIDQHEKKFVSELREALGAVMPFAEYTYDGMHKFVPDRDHMRKLLAKIGVEQGVGKHEFPWSSWIANLSESNLKAFLKSFCLADGHKVRGKWVIKQNQGEVLEAVKLAINMTGHMVYSSAAKCVTVYTQGSQYVSGQCLSWDKTRVTDVFCLSNTNESFVMRQNGQIVLTGNCTYGAQAAKVAKTIGSSLVEGEMVFDAFWKAALPLAKLKEALQKHWEKNDKKYIITIDGRKVPTRAAHAILNSLFQSAGVICAKRSMVRWETLMRKESLWVDFWKEDWKASSFAMQMIAYHDEAQIEVTKDLVKFKRFATKEECKEFRKQQKEVCGMIWSEEHESPKGGWFVAYSKPGELVVQAVNETTEFYKLCVPLSADYVLGTGWHDCH